MQELQHQATADERESRALPAFPWWAVVLATVIGFGLPLLLLRSGPRPLLFPPLVDAAGITTGSAIYLASLFALLVAAASTLGARLAGSSGALASGILLTLCWPALLFLPLAPKTYLLGLLLLVVTLLFTRGARAATVAWIGLFAIVATLLLPALRDSSVGLWSVPEGLSWAQLVFWRQHSALASPFPYLGASALLAVGLSSLLVLRGRFEARVVAALLFVALLPLLFMERGWALLPFILALAAAMGGAWVDAVWRATRGAKLRALAALVLPALVLLGLGAKFSSVNEAELFDVELTLRLQRAAILGDRGRYAEAEEEIAVIRERLPEDRRVKLATAELLLQREKYKLAARAFKQLRLDHPEWRDCLMGSGWANFHTQSYRTARRDFEEILEEDPRNPLAMIGLGTSILHADNNVDEAARLISEGLAIDDDLSEGHHHMATLLLGTTRNVFKDEDRAERIRYHARRTLELDPGNGRMRRFVRRMGWTDLLEEFPRPPHAARGEGSGP